MAHKKLDGLTIDMRQGERLEISGPATVELLHKSGQLARLRVTASPDVKIAKDHLQNHRSAVPSMAT